MCRELGSPRRQPDLRGSLLLRAARVLPALLEVVFVPPVCELKVLKPVRIQPAPLRKLDLCRPFDEARFMPPRNFRVSYFWRPCRSVAALVIQPLPRCSLAAVGAGRARDPGPAAQAAHRWGFPAGGLRSSPRRRLFSAGTFWLLLGAQCCRATRGTSQAANPDTRPYGAGPFSLKAGSSWHSHAVYGGLGGACYTLLTPLKVCPLRSRGHLLCNF